MNNVRSYKLLLLIDCSKHYDPRYAQLSRTQPYRNELEFVSLYRLIALDTRGPKSVGDRHVESHQPSAPALPWFKSTRLVYPLKSPC